MLNSFIEKMSTLANMLPTQIIGIKNIESHYVYCSPSFATLLGYSVEDIVGKHDMFVNNENMTRIREDQQIIKTRKALSFIHIDNLKGRLSPLTFIKSPIIDDKSNQVIGILCQVFEFATIDMAQQILNMYHNLQLDKQNKQLLPKLTKREKQIIFFFLANLNSAEIVEVIYRMENKKISKGTIDGVFTDQLFPKFEVYNRQALYTKLVQLGYNKLIPLEVLPKKIIELDTCGVY